MNKIITIRVNEHDLKNLEDIKKYYDKNIPQLNIKIKKKITTSEIIKTAIEVLHDEIT